MLQACMYEKKLWIIHSVDPSSHKFVLRQFDSEKTILVEPSLVRMVDAHVLADTFQKQAEEHAEILDPVDTDNVSLKRQKKAQERYNAISAELAGDISAKAAAENANCLLANTMRSSVVTTRRLVLRQCLARHVAARLARR